MIESARTVDSPPMRRILVRSPSWVGDAVMATPALRALRYANPTARITLEGREELAGLYRGLSSFDEYLVDPGRGLRAAGRRVRNLRGRNFDLAVLLPDSPRAALGPYLARIPRRVGHTRDPLRRALLTDSLRHPERNGQRIPIPTIERYLEITRRLGCADRGTEPELQTAPDAAGRVVDELASHGIPADRELLIVAPGASFGTSKLWPTEHFAKACDRIAAELGLVPVLAPAPSELSTAQRIGEQMSERTQRLIYAPPDLENLKALIERSRLVLSNDTGPRHMAVALGRPVVVVMGPTNPRHTALHLERQRVLRRDLPCSPCQLKRCPIDHRCMIGLSPDSVVSAARDLLEPPPLGGATPVKHSAGFAD